jgi:hypothetical protein
MLLKMEEVLYMASNIHHAKNIIGLILANVGANMNGITVWII